MTTFSLSNAPSSTLFPGLSPLQDPNYNNAFQVDFSSLRNNTSPIPDYAKQFAINSLNLVNRTKADIGLTFASLDSPSTQFLGKEMLLQSIDNEPTFITPTKEKIPFSTKFMNSTFGKNYTLLNGVYDTANTLSTGIFGEKSEYSGDKGNITRSMDLAYDTIQDVVGNFGAVGKVASLGMGASKLLTNTLNKITGGTSGNTTLDAVAGSSLFNATGVGMLFNVINSLGGKKADTITKDNKAFEQVGTSYGGVDSTVNSALKLSGDKYGLFSLRALRDANNLINEAKRLQEVMSDIADEATDRFAIRNSMAAINGNRRAYLLQGGYDLSNVRVGRNGMNIELLNRARKVVKLSLKLLTGGVISDPFEVYLLSLPLALRDSTDFRVRDYWEYNGRPKNFDEARKKGMFKWKEDFDLNGNSIGWSWHAFIVAKNPNADEYDFMKPSSHPTVLKEIDWYNSDAGSEFRKEYELLKVLPYYKYVKRKAPYKDVPIHKEGGSIIELVSLPTEILLVDPNEVPEFQDGGQINKKPRTLLELIEYAKKENPRFILRMSEPPRGIDFVDDEGKLARGSHYMEWSTDDSGKAIIYPRIQEVGKELKFFNGSDAYKRAIENKNYLIMTPEEAEIFFAKDPKYGTAYKSGWPLFFDKFQQGGSINVIPDGSLHARKHNMDVEGITPKGIPVIDNDGEQQAEIEREELIIRLEVTKKLEELEKKFYDNETSQKEKDEYALEAGKLLVEEILYNTQDNTKSLL